MIFLCINITHIPIYLSTYLIYKVSNFNACEINVTQRQILQKLMEFWNLLMYTTVKGPPCYTYTLVKRYP